MKNQREPNAGKEDTNEHGEKLSFMLTLTCVRFHFKCIIYLKVFIVNTLYLIK